MINEEDTQWMEQALQVAQQAWDRDEVPVGALVVRSGELVTQAGNATIGDCDPTAHAEIKALRHAALILNNHRLTDVTVYVTLEPCAMCIGAMVQARVRRLVFGAFDQRSGAVGSVFDIANEARLNHRIEYQGGVLQERCAQLLKDFFRSRR